MTSPEQQGIDIVHKHWGENGFDIVGSQRDIGLAVQAMSSEEYQKFLESFTSEMLKMNKESKNKGNLNQK